MKYGNFFRSARTGVDHRIAPALRTCEILGFRGALFGHSYTRAALPGDPPSKNYRHCFRGHATTHSHRCFATVSGRQTRALGLILRIDTPSEGRLVWL